VHDAAGEIIDDGVSGVLVDQTDTSSLADCVVDLLRDDARRAEMGAEGHRRLQREFSYAQFSRRLLTQIEGTLGDPMREVVSTSGMAH
jgi:glycosyltransferase involved in cell wall biosynthesis